MDGTRVCTEREEVAEARVDLIAVRHGRPSWNMHGASHGRAYVKRKYHSKITSTEEEPAIA